MLWRSKSADVGPGNAFSLDIGSIAELEFLGYCVSWRHDI